MQKKEKKLVKASGRANLTPAGNAAAGALAGMFAVCLSYPFDLIKTRTHFEVAKAGTVKNLSIPFMARKIYAEGGIFSFYRGLDQLLPEAAFKTMVRFVVFKKFQEGYKELTGAEKITVFGNLLAGAASGAVETTVVVQPWERGKTLRADFKSPYKVWGGEFRQNGFMAFLRSVYIGYLPCLGRQVGNQAVAFPVFYSIKEAYLEKSGNRELSPIQRVVLGFFSGACACCFTMPMDVTKSVAQKQTGANTVGMVTIMGRIVREKGPIGLYAGVRPRILRVGLDRAFGFLAFDTLADWMTGFSVFRQI